MRQTAERALAEAVELSAVQPYFVGNAPAGHVQLGSDATHFFHRWAAAGECRICLRDALRAGQPRCPEQPQPGLAEVFHLLPSAPLSSPRCQLIQGVPALRGGSGFTEHVWVAKDELAEYIEQPEVLAVLQKML